MTHHRIVPVLPTDWMTLSAHEVVGISHEQAATGFAAMLASAPQPELSALSDREAAACIDLARRRAEADDRPGARSWAQHLVDVVQECIAHRLGARLRAPRPAAATGDAGPPG